MRTTRGLKVTLLAGAAVVVLLSVVAWANRESLRSWYVLWREFERIGNNEQGYREYRHRETGIVMVMLPGGTFSMGTPKEEIKRLIAEVGEDWRERLEREQQRNVTLGPFLIAKYGAPGKVWERGKSCRAT